ncbi:BZ3500_MvSof-1268-A1-R1_Chr7-3g09572 [Microbotryum saponariae]|uniref:BZ3500_MvSof-1268-A1-R1_Chr7-3g09572 protein n=1 Tax=Microbotryum saponariae TaxID=289078 RepID=A0A2X0LSK1_9BASI|nr:BZ3501_MvSof-1269-A2-R1_Chr7-2g09295 [Microbotryum saponariae]SDA02223.1 BZ3500_MvSof-1268-A1-R1_Chr7-3g09572 [Microbotryum saponariae]
MAIFSSSKKSKKDTPNTTGTSQPLNQSQSSNSFSRSASGSLVASVDRPPGQQLPTSPPSSHSQSQATSMGQPLHPFAAENALTAATRTLGSDEGANVAATDMAPGGPESSPAPSVNAHARGGGSGGGYAGNGGSGTSSSTSNIAQGTTSLQTHSNSLMSQPQPAGQSSHTVLYPWAQRRLVFAPTALFPPLDSNNPTAAPAIVGPASPPPFPRYGHSVNPVAAVSTGELYIFGGLVQNAVKNDLYVLNCTGGFVHTTSNLPSGSASSPISIGLVETRGEVPGPRVGHASVGVGNVLIVWGGDTKSRPEDLQDDGLYLLNLSTKEWTRVKTIGPAPEGRYGHAASMVGSKFYIFGGQKDDGGFMNDLVWFDLQKLKAGSPKWTFIDYASGAVVPPRRTGHTTVTHGDCIYVFGGTDGQYHYNDTWCFDTNTGVWVELSCIGYIPVPREGHAATLVDDVMYVFGGRGVDGKDLEDLAAFEITNQRWFMFQNMGPAPSGRSGHAMATWQNKVFVLGGESYTAQRHDDPGFIHVLDTGKIKYPSDAARQSSVPRKMSSPTMGTPSSPIGNVPRSNGEEDRRAASPNSPNGSQHGGRLSPNGRPSLSSFGQVFAPHRNGSPASLPSTLAHGSKRTYSSSPPARPARPETLPSPAMGALESASEERALSPSGSQRPRGAAPSPFPSSPIQPGFSPQSLSASAASASQFGDRTANGSSSVAAEPEAVKTPTPLASAIKMNGVMTRNPNDDSRGQDAQSYSELLLKNEEIAVLKARELWLTESLSLATQRGYKVTVGAREGESSASATPSDPATFAMILQVKENLAETKRLLAEEAETVEERVRRANAGRIVALQEAAYYRSKAAALERGIPADFAAVERERARTLEDKLAQALATQSALELRVTQLELDVDRHVDLRTVLEEQRAMATNRADAAEASYARALSDCAEVQRRAQSHESTIQVHAQKIVTLTAASSQLEAKNSSLGRDLESSRTEVDQHAAAVEQTHAALLAASNRNDELYALWEKATADATEHRSRGAKLQTELDAQRAEFAALSERATNLERTLTSTREAYSKAQILITNGLVGLTASRHEQQNQDVGSESTEQVERARALERERDDLLRLHQDMLTKYGTSTSELDGALQREALTRSQLAELQNELASCRQQHALALDEAARHRSALLGAEAKLNTATQIKEAAEVKSVLMRSVLSDHGLSPVADADLATRFPPLSGTDSPELLQRRAEDLEARLEQRAGAYREVEASLASERKTSASKVEALQRSLQDLQSRSPVESAADRERATKAEFDLATLQERHRQLEGTHLKAVSYVKELTRYKERCEEFEAKDKAPRPEHVAELETLRSALTQAQNTSGELERQITSLREEHTRTLQTSRVQSEQQLHQMTGEVTRLDKELRKAQNDLEETLAVNASLNKELTSALKNTGSSTRGSRGADEMGRLEAELTQAQNKAEWLKRENAQLETRCRTAESKISILLDHLEGAPAEASEGAGSK